MKKMYCLVVTDDFSRFSWVFFLATKDETSEILKTFITGIENLIDLRVKVIRCDNETKFKNRVMNQFCEMKGIKREFSVARTPQQNRVAERKNKTLIEASRTMLVDSKLPTTLWPEAVEKPALSFMTPFGCPVSILNTIDHLGSRPNWLFDIDALTKLINYKPVVTRNQSNGTASTKACDDNSKDSPDAGFKPSGEEEKMDTEDPRNESEASGKDSKVLSTEEPREDQRVNQELDASINNTNNINNASNGNGTNNVNDVSSTVNAAGIEVNAVNPKTRIKLPNDPNMPELEDIVYSDDDEDVGAEADMNNLDAFMPVSPIPTTRIHKDHPVEQIIGDLNSTPQTRRMTKNLKEHEAMHDELLQFKLQRFGPQVIYQMAKRAIETNGFTGTRSKERGLQVKQKEDGIFISQDKYVTEILRKFGFSDVKTASTPMETQKPLLKDADGKDVDDVTPLYRKVKLRKTEKRHRTRSGIGY
ncbi:putative ribonuclease H-like domain-containing protein [Tanacetum coccineum]